MREEWVYDCFKERFYLRGAELVFGFSSYRYHVAILFTLFYSEDRFLSRDLSEKAFVPQHCEHPSLYQDVLRRVFCLLCILTVLKSPKAAQIF